jgi:hypothetical protein
MIEPGENGYLITFDQYQIAHESGPKMPQPRLPLMKLKGSLVYAFAAGPPAPEPRRPGFLLTDDEKSPLRSKPSMSEMACSRQLCLRGLKMARIPRLYDCISRLHRDRSCRD